MSKKTAGEKTYLSIMRQADANRKKAERLDAVVAMAEARLRDLRKTFARRELAGMPEAFTLKEILKEAKG